MEAAATQVPPLHQTQKHVPFMKNTLLITNCILLTIGHCGGPLVTRLYFIHGGKRIWLSSCLITAGWPFMLIILIATFCLRHGGPGPGPTSSTKLFNMKPRLFLASLVIGTLTGVDDYIYAYGVAKLPVSTLALVIATQLAFTAVFSYLLVKQKFTSYSLNAVVLLTIGAGVLALHTSTDRPNGESKSEYVVGFVVTFGAAVLYGLILPLIQLTYQKAKQVVDYQLVMEIQIVMCLFATVFCIIGMVINNDFKAITREARSYELGETMYYVVLVCIAMIWQFFFLGAAGIIFCASSLLSGIIIAVLLPVTEVLAVIFYQEKFQAEKGVALILSLWGFVSYFYGEMKHNNKMKKNRRVEMQVSLDHNVVP